MAGNAPIDPFDADYRRGEAQAKKLEAAQERALRRAEEFEAQQKRNAEQTRNLGDLDKQVRREVAADRIKGETIGEKEASRVQQRARDEEAVNRQVRERNDLLRQEEQRLARQERAMANLMRSGPYAYTQQSLRLAQKYNQYPALPPPATGPGSQAGFGGQRVLFGAVVNPPTPPREPPPPPYWYYQRALGPGGPPPPQLGSGGRPPLQIGPGAGQRLLTERTPTHPDEIAASQGRLGQAYRTSAAAATQMNKVGEGLNRTLAAEQGIVNAANTQFQRFGALSTEWIGAAARGTTTIRELGIQTRDTIGKFGGWIIAGSAVFAAIDAVRELGTGALDSSSGVNQLDRVVNNIDVDHVKQGFRDLSDEFNLPVGQVADAAYQMGKVFHDQDQALEASRAVLYSVKVGELDVATATRYLTAIVNGFNLTASDQTRIFDQINQAQNKFGVNIGDTEAGVAKAAGTFRAAGGDFDHLLALITTAQKATGNTGQVVGTALARAPNFLRQAQNQATLQSFGIDARANIDTIIEQAFQKAQGLSGERLQVLAASIFGPQYGARIGTPLLQQQDLYQRVLKQTSPEASKGSAQRELNTLLGSVREQIAEIGIELQKLGSGLEQAGFLDAFGLFLKLLIRSLELVNNLVDVFNTLPKPVRQGVVYAAQFLAIMKVLRHFNTGDLFKEGSRGRAFFSAPNRDVKLFQEGLTNSATDFSRRREAAAGRAASGAIGVEVAQTKAADAEAKYAAASARLSVEAAAAVDATAAGVLSKEEAAKLSAKDAAAAKEALTLRSVANSTEQAVVSARARQLDAEIEEIALLKAQEAVEAEKTELIEAGSLQRQRQLIAESEQVGLGGFGRPTTARDEMLRRGYVTHPETGELVPPGTAGTQAAQATERAAKGIETPTRLGGYYAAGQRRIAQATERVSRWGQSVERNGRISGRALAIGGRTLVGTGRAIGTIGRGLAGFASAAAGMIGPLDLVLVGGFLLYEAFKSAGDAAEDRTKAFQKATHQAPKTRAQFDKAREQMQRAFDEQDDRATSEYVTGGVKNLLTGRVHLGTSFLEGSDYTIDIPTPLDPFLDSGDEEAQKKAEEEYKNKRRIQSAQLKLLINRNNALRALFRGDDAIKGGVVFPEDVADAMDQYVKAFVSGPVKNFSKFRERVNNLIKEIRGASDLSAQQKRLQISGVRAREIQELGGVGTFQALAGISPEQLQTVIENYGKVLGTAGIGGEKDVQGILRASLVQIARKVHSRTPQGRAFAADALSSMSDSISAYAKEDLDRALTFANTVEEENKAYAEFYRSTSPKAARAVGKALKESLTRELDRNTKQIAQAQRELQQVGNLNIHAGGAFDIAGNLKRLTNAAPFLNQIHGLRQRNKAIHKILKGIEDAQDLAIKELKKVQQDEAREQQTQNRIDLVTTQGEIAAARIQRTDPVGAARKSLAAAQKALSILRASGTGDPRELASALLAVINAKNAVLDAADQEAQALADATAALATARAHGDPVVAAQAAITNARSALARADTEAERRQALADLLNAQDDLDQAFADIATARVELASARTDDPVKQANLAIRAANIAIANAHGQAEQLQAQQQRAEAVRQRRDAVAQKRIDDIEFQADLGKLTTDQEIAAYERLLKTLTLSRDMRRDIRRKIHDLKSQLDQEDGFELSVGDIRLPTIYDIRRAVQGGINSNPQTNYNDNRTQTINMTVKGGGSPQETAKAVDGVLNRNNRSARRSAGLLP